MKRKNQIEMDFSKDEFANIGLRTKAFRLAIEKAIVEDREVGFSYTNFRGYSSYKVIRPIKVLKIQNGMLNLRAFCKEKQEERNFAIRRIEDLKVLGPAEQEEKDVAEIFLAEGFEVIDKRPSKGCLWIVTGKNKGARSKFERICKKHNLEASFAENGSKATARRPGFYFQTNAA